MHIARLYVYISFPFSKNLNIYISFQPNDEFNEVLIYGRTSKGDSLFLYTCGGGRIKWEGLG